MSGPDAPGVGEPTGLPADRESTLAGLLSGDDPQVLQRWHSARTVDEIAHIVQAADWTFAHLDGAFAQTKPEVLAALGTALDFPDWYGQNLDALDDLLSDIASPAQPSPDQPSRAQPVSGAGGAQGLRTGTVLLWDDWQIFAAADPGTFGVLLQILAAHSGQPGQRPFIPLLR